MSDHLKKIVMIGPVYPYKGGISHYTSLMYRALSKKYDVEMISFKMQYPKFLFPKEQKDYSNDTFRIEDTKYWIHTADPINCLITARTIKKMKPDLILFQWWHPYFAPCYWIMMKVLRKYSILAVCHNVFPHERFPMDRFLTKCVLHHADKYIVQSKKDAKDLLEIIPHANYRQAVHPTYNAFRIENMSREKARELLQVKKEAKILLFFGFIREYKGLKHLIRALPDVIKVFEDLLLYVVGDFGNSKQEYIELIQSMGVWQNVVIQDEYIPDREVEKYFAASDLVVLPYESATQSGIVQIAYGFEKPVIVTDVGGLPDVVTDGLTGYIIKAKNSEKLAEAVVKYFKENQQEVFKRNVKEEAYRFEWDRLVETVEVLV